MKPGALFGYFYSGQPFWIFCPSNKCVGKVVPYLIPSGIRREAYTRRTVDPAGSCFARTLPRGHKLRGKQVPQAGFELWLTHLVRTHPTTTNPILVRPPSAPNGLTRRGITSKNTFLDVSKDAIAGGLSLSRVPWMEMLVFAAMVALYGGLPVTFTRVTRLVLVPIMYSIHGHPSAHSHWAAALFQGIRHRHPQKWWDTWKDTVLKQRFYVSCVKVFFSGNYI